jgi:putative oxidoreductase
MIYHGYMTLFGVTDGVPNIDLFIRGAVEQKLGWPFPELLGYLAKGSEFFGGMLLVLGLLTRVAAFLIGATMAVAAFIIHGDAIIEEGELALVYFVISLVIFIVGPGKYSIDHRLT